MSEKISLVLDTVVKGTKDILSSTTATERLTAAIAEQRDEIIHVNKDLKKVNGYQSAITSMQRLRKQYQTAEADIQSLSKEQADHNKHTRQLRVEYKATEKEIETLNAQFKKASGEAVPQLKNKLDAAKNRMNALNIEMSEGKVRTSELNQAYKQASKRVTNLNDKQEKQTDKLRKLSSELKQAGVDTTRLANAQRKLEQQSKEATAAIAKQNEHLKQRKAITDRMSARSGKLSELGGEATTLAMQAAPIGASVWSAVKNESSFADVKKVVNMSSEEATQLRSWSLHTSASKEGGGLSANDINNMLAAGGQSGIKDLNELKSFVLDSAAMGVAFDMDAGQAGETLATFKAALGLDQKGAIGLAGTANYLSNNMNAKAGDIAGVMTREGASAKMAGFNVNESSALAASMLATGMNEERAATALKNISGRLTSGAAATGGQKKAFSSIGFNAEQLSASMQSDASGTLIEVLNAITDAPLEEQGALISQIFGEEAKGAVSSLAGNMGLLKEALGLANKEQSVHVESLQNEFSSRISTTENGIDSFINKITRLSVIFGNALLPALNSVLEPLGNAIMWLGDFAEANEGVTSAVAIGVTGFIALKAALMAGKAASLVFGNSIDKAKLLRHGLDRETTSSAKAARYATRQFRQLGDALYNIKHHKRGGRSGSYTGSQSGKSKRYSSRRSKRRSRNPLARALNLGQRVFSSTSNKMNSARHIVSNTVTGSSSRAYSAASNVMRSNNGAVPLSLVGGGLAMMPMMSAAQDVMDIGGDVAEGAGKAGLNKLLRPLSMAISAGNIATALAEGETKEAITEGGGLLGGMGGASLGAAIGTAILPGVGTVVGGLVGSLAGDFIGESLGEWVGNKVMPIPNKLMPPEQVETKLAENKYKEEKQKAAQSLPSMQFQIVATPNMDEEKLSQLVSLKVQQALERSFQMTGLSMEDSLSVSYIDT